MAKLISDELSLKANIQVFNNEKILNAYKLRRGGVQMFKKNNDVSILSDNCSCGVACGQKSSSQGKNIHAKKNNKKP